jgi:uncharacterized protein
MAPSLIAATHALAGGLLIGLAVWLLLAALGRVTGISGIAAAALMPEAAERGAERTWRLFFLLGLVGGGGLMAVMLSLPGVITRPAPLLIIAGLLVGVGTVVSAGCTSGHGVCGLGRRSARSLVATACFMAFGVLTVIATNLIAA